MKALFKIGALFFVAFLFSSCLKKDLPELPLYNGNDITNFYVEYRFEDPSTIYNGKPVVAYQKLQVSQQIDTVQHMITASITVPDANGAFTQEQRAKVNINELWPYFDISTAATIKAVDGTPEAGDQTDCSKPLTYDVTAANGKSQKWTITITSLTK